MFEIIQLAHYEPGYYIQSGRHYTFSLKFNTNASIFHYALPMWVFLPMRVKWGRKRWGAADLGGALSFNTCKILWSQSLPCPHSSCLGFQSSVVFCCCLEALALYISPRFPVYVGWVEHATSYSIFDESWCRVYTYVGGRRKMKWLTSLFFPLPVGKHVPFRISDCSLFRLLLEVCGASVDSHYKTP